MDNKKNKEKKVKNNKKMIGYKIYLNKNLNIYNYYKILNKKK